MGCVNCKKAKNRKERDTLVETAARETERERLAASEQGRAVQQLCTPVPAVNALPSTAFEDAASLSSAPSSSASRQRQSAVSALPRETEKGQGWDSNEEADTQAIIKADNGNTTAALTGVFATTSPLVSSRETPKERGDMTEYCRYRGGSSRSDRSLSIPVDAVRSAKYPYSSTMSNSGPSAPTHHSKKDNEEKRHDSSGSTATEEVRSQENSGDSVAHGRLHSASHSQKAEGELPSNGLTGEGTASSTHSHQTKQQKMHSRGSSNVSSDLHGNSTPSGMGTNVYPSMDALDNDAGAGGRSCGDVPAAIPASNTVMQSGHTTTEAPSVFNRASFEPYSDVDLRDLASYLPPYEWAPRTLPVPSPLRACGPVDMAQWEARENQLCGLGATGTTARFQDAMASMSSECATTPDSGAAECHYDLSHPLTLHKFYPRLAPLQLALLNSEGNARRPEVAASAFNHPSLAVNAFLQQGHSWQHQPAFQSMYEGDASAHYSPADYASHAATPRQAVSPSLVDVHVSEESGYVPPSPVYAAYSYPSPALLPTHQSHPVSDRGSGKPMSSSHALPAISTGAPENCQDGKRSRSSNISVTGMSGGAHPHKPVSYLFDSSMDDWLQSRSLQPQQRQLYGEPVDMW
ncbi:hypothetical protein, unknown function [Leishmania tarentolae]|uniref:Uncharacterized protein n=1 Tax=Leishmania tarentolae TaxID=5689 RepID=A0A640KPM6_LEITA|nr:hypothetical protein, unknown function [Leishmania tarentolae]